LADVEQRVLEGQLTTAVHSFGLLKAELEREERLLEHDREQLAKLKKDAKTQSRLWDQQNKAVSASPKNRSRILLIMF
jgi:hypothetical protein